MIFFITVSITIHYYSKFSVNTLITQVISTICYGYGRQFFMAPDLSPISKINYYSNHIFYLFCDLLTIFSNKMLIGISLILRPSQTKF